jgi:hypothetical protein
MDAVAELKNRLPDLSELSEIELPRMEEVGRAAGRSADESIDRLLGKARNPIWPWVAGALGLAVVIGVIAAYMAWLRRWSVETPESESGWTPEPLEGSRPLGSAPVSELGTSPLDV